MRLASTVQDRPLVELHGRERLLYTLRRIRGYLHLAITAPRKLGIYPQLCLLAGIGVLFGPIMLVISAAVAGAGARLGLDLIAFGIISGVLLAAFAVVAGIGLGVIIIGLDPVRGRDSWQLTTIHTEAGYAAFRYRRHPDRDGYQLVDLWTTQRGAKLGFGRIVPYLVDKLGAEPMHLTA